MPKARTRHTCTECSLRRQQCDRRQPCGRCISRGVPDKCQLNWPDGQYDPAKHRVYPSRPRQLRPQTSQSMPISVSASPSGDSRDRSPEYGLEPSFAIHAASSQGAEPGRVYSTPTAPRPRYVFTPYEPIRLRTTATEVAGRANSSFLASKTGLGSSGAPYEAFLQTLLPSVDHIWKLVDYHEQYLLWYHCCYHGPTFRSELENVIAEQNDKTTLNVSRLNLQWLALLFSIMTGSLTCTAEGRLRDWGFSKSETIKLSMQWYKAAIVCLNHGEWTSDHHLYSVQTITTLVISAHSLGCSDQLSVLLGAALKVAQALGLDRLNYDAAMEQIDKSSSNVQRHRMLKRDIGRKVWSQLCVQDWTSLPFAGSHSINPCHFTSTLPSSRDYLTMEHVPPTFPTYVSYGNYLFEIAKLVMRHHEATLQSTTAFTRYQHVLDYDTKMRDLATKGMPKYFHVVEPVEAVWPEWVHWARSSLTVCFAHKIIMIHRDYLRQSFTDPAYSVTRITCIAAAKTILHEANQARGMDAPIIWIDKAFCVAAALILCLDIYHRADTDPLFATHKALVKGCIEMLHSFDCSVIAVRGYSLLSMIIAERAGGNSGIGWPPPHIDMSDMVQLVSTTPYEHQFILPGLATKTSSTELFPPPTGFNNKSLFEILSNRNTPGD